MASIQKNQAILSGQQNCVAGEDYSPPEYIEETNSLGGSSLEFTVEPAHQKKKSGSSFKRYSFGRGSLKNSNSPFKTPKRRNSLDLKKPTQSAPSFFKRLPRGKKKNGDDARSSSGGTVIANNTMTFSMNGGFSNTSPAHVPPRDKSSPPAATRSQTTDSAVFKEGSLEPLFGSKSNLFDSTELSTLLKEKIPEEIMEQSTEGEAERNVEDAIDEATPSTTAVLKKSKRTFDPANLDRYKCNSSVSKMTDDSTPRGGPDTATKMLTTLPKSEQEASSLFGESEPTANCKGVPTDDDEPKSEPFWMKEFRKCKQARGGAISSPEAEALIPEWKKQPLEKKKPSLSPILKAIPKKVDSDSSSDLPQKALDILPPASVPVTDTSPSDVAVPAASYSIVVTEKSEPRSLEDILEEEVAKNPKQDEKIGGVFKKVEEESRPSVKDYDFFGKDEAETKNKGDGDLIGNALFDDISAKTAIKSPISKKPGREDMGTGHKTDPGSKKPKPEPAPPPTAKKPGKGDTAAAGRKTDLGTKKPKPEPSWMEELKKRKQARGGDATSPTPPKKDTAEPPMPEWKKRALERKKKERENIPEVIVEQSPKGEVERKGEGAINEDTPYTTAVPQSKRTFDPANHKSNSSVSDSTPPDTATTKPTASPEAKQEASLLFGEGDDAQPFWMEEFRKCKQARGVNVGSPAPPTTPKKELVEAEAPMPEWKKQLIEKKKIENKKCLSSPIYKVIPKKVESDSSSHLPQWKRQLLEKKKARSDEKVSMMVLHVCS